MRLKFVPAAGLCVPYPGRGAGDNHFAGRSISVKTENDVTTISHPADAEPVEAVAGTREADRFIQFVRRDGDMYPFDEATAKACGVPFMPVERGADGEWVQRASKPAARKAAE